MLEAFRKILMYDLNLEYTYNENIDVQTNYLINRQMNEFEYLFMNSPERIFILDYKDDLLSLICYRMLKNLQSICKFSFQIYIMGKTHHTKTYIKKEKKISKIRALSFINKKGRCVIVQPVNPLYNVLKIKKNFKDFRCKTWTPIARFTPKQLEKAQIFYHIGYLKKDKIQLNSKEVEDFNLFLTGENDEWCRKYLYLYLSYYSKPVAAVKLTGDIEKDNNLLQEVENYDGLVFYFYNTEDSSLLSLLSIFSNCVKNRVNVPNKDNTNNIEIPYYIHKNFTDVRINFIGDWDYDNRKYTMLGED